MLKNYLIIAIRNLMRYKGYSLINILGLAIGMACCILILLFVQHELSYDRFHEHADRIYRVTTQMFREDGSPDREVPRLSGPMTPLLREELPELTLARVYRVGNALKYEDRSAFQSIYYTEPDFFEIFTFPLLSGDAKTALVEPYSMVISQDLAKQYFGDEDPIGKTLKYGDEKMITNDGKMIFTIKGVFDTVPQNAHFRFEVLASFTTLPKYKPDYFFNWGNRFFTYVLLPEGDSPERLEMVLPDYMRRHRPDDRSTYTLQPLASIHLYSNLRGELAPQGSVETIYTYAMIGVLILAVACFNFMNLATSRASARAREVGMRKVVGADRLQLVRQFMGESMLLALLSLLVALGLVVLALPRFELLIGQQLAFGSDLFIYGGLIGITLVVGLLAGLYPAVYLSNFKPVDVLKGQVGMVRSRLRSLLVVFQFGASVVFIVSAGIVYQQLEYCRNAPLGLDDSQVVVLPRPYFEWPDFFAIKQTFLQNPDVKEVTISSIAPGSPVSYHQVKMGLESQQREVDLRFGFVNTDVHFLDTYDIKLLTGRNFSADFATDSTSALIINETAVKALGFSVEQAVGQGLKFWDKNWKIIGVMADAHFESLREPVRPLAMRIQRGDPFGYVSVKINHARVPETLQYLETHWRRLLLHRPFYYWFADEKVDQLYQREESRSEVFGVFSALAVFVACLGLFGLASYTITQRTKEIGIRKVLGAEDAQVVVMVTREFIKLVVLGTLIACPIAYYLMSDWLANFAYRISIGPLPFMIGGILALLVAVLTVGFQAVKAAGTNPVDALKYE